MKAKTVFCSFALSLLLLLLTGCSMGEELADWAAGKANDALEVIGGGVQDALDELHDAEYQGGPFENNLDSARAYLLEQMHEKYGIEFTVIGDEDLENYGPLMCGKVSYKTFIELTAAPAIPNNLYRPDSAGKSLFPYSKICGIIHRRHIQKLLSVRYSPHRHLRGQRRLHLFALSSAARSGAEHGGQWA